MSPRKLDTITIQTPLGPVALVTDEKTGRARGATPLDAERMARVGERMATAVMLSVVPKAKRKMTIRDLRRLPAKRKRDGAEAGARAADSLRPKREAADAVLEPKVRKMDADGFKIAAIARKLHIHRRRVRRLLSE